ncbi:MAG: hypothetical protein R6U96_06425, partial [Promethearchaeia archaeon]
MNNKSKKLLALFTAVLFFSSSLMILTAMNRQGDFNESSNLGDDSNIENEQTKQRMPELSTLNQLQTTGTSIGVLGYTDAVKEKSYGLNDWEYHGEVGGTEYYKTADSYSVPFPLSVDGGFNPQWNFKQTTIAISELREYNDFFWDKNFNDWSPSSKITGEYGDAATVGQDENNGSINFHNYQTKYSKTPSAGDWNINVVENNYSPDQWARTESDDFTNTEIDGTCLDGDTPCGDNGIHADNDYYADHSPADGAFSTQNHIQTGYYVHTWSEQQHDSTDYHDCWLQFTDGYKHTLKATYQFDYDYYGTTPHEATFDGNLGVDFSESSNLDGSSAYGEASVILYNEDKSRSRSFYDDNFGKGGFSEDISDDSNFGSFFNEQGPYILEIRILTDISIEADKEHIDDDDSGDFAFDGTGSGTYNIGVDTINFDIKEEQPYPEDYIYLEETIEFNGREVQSSPRPEFIFDYS